MGTHGRYDIIGSCSGVDRCGLGLHLPHPHAPSIQQQAAQHNKFLWGNFAPVEGGFYAASLPVTEGRIPPELSGLFARNGTIYGVLGRMGGIAAVGPAPISFIRPVKTAIHTTTPGPNPSFIEAGYHWFDGSGFVHAVQLDPASQSANYSAQFVETSILKVGPGQRCWSIGSIYYRRLVLSSVHLSVDTTRAHCLQYPSAFSHPRGAAPRGVMSPWMDVAALGSMAVPQRE